jgi:hypothetical protein
MGAISAINWASGSLYLKTEIDETGSGIYTEFSAVELLTVPYALFANEVVNKDDADADPTNEIQDLDVTNNVLSITNNSSATQINLASYQGTNTDEQLLSLDGTEISISGGNTVDLNPILDSSYWKNKGNSIYFNGGKVGIGTSSPGSQLEVKADNSFGATDTLFSVKDKDGNVVFAVYPEGAQVFVNEGKKGRLGGFAVSGRGTTKGEVNYMEVTPDSTRIYINENAAKGRLGGFAVSGRGTTKGADKEYFNISGSSSAEIIDPSEARIMWYPKKEAFLTGRIIVESPDDVGLNSFTTGFESKAIGDYSQAMGYKSISRGDYSIAIGYNAVAGTDTSEGAFAFGYEAQALGKNSFVVGDSAIATGINSVAIGSSFRDFTYDYTDGTFTVNAPGPAATADNALAIGPGTKALGGGSLAFGAFSESSAPFASAFGLYNYATSYAAMAIGGEGNHANEERSVVVGGYDNIVNGEGAVIAGGDMNEIAANAKFSAIIGGGWSYAEGIYSAVLGGIYNSTTGDYSAVLGGRYLDANDHSEIVLGQYNVVSTGSSTSWNSSDNILVVGNGANFGNRSNALSLQKNGNMTLAGTLTTSGFKLESGASSGDVLTSDANGNASWQAAAGGSAWTENGGYLYYNSGNVGIGIIDPAAAFEVLTTLKSAVAFTSSNTNGTWLDIGNLSGSFWSLISTGSGNSEGAGKLLFRDESGNNRMTISTDGNVGIGTDTPKSALQVQGGIQVGNDSDTASADKVGTFRYRETANNSYLEICMKTGASTYVWFPIKTYNWLIE